ncbi:exodeoxyribonuclease I [Candidatus Saccharibacteria bacterium]|nr:exodeoxyribonuclease I [Candidatus Saccharibacteria bacterium]
MTPETFFFYDLETSGLSPREDRIMQFAGQRTDKNLKPIGEPVNLLVKLGSDTLPSPGAIMVTKITPQQTLADGLTEAEFCDYIENEIFTPGTCAIGYNSVRFDDEFMRHTFWRNFRDPYAWSWKDGRSRWDLLDVVRLARALRPDGIFWPEQEVEYNDKETGEKKKALAETNRLELITKLNGIVHAHAHDALSDVEALIDVTRLIKEKQPKLYEYLFAMRDKRQVAKLVNLENKAPFVYACGRYSGEYHKTTVAFPLTAGRNGNVIVFDLRYNLDELLNPSERHLATTGASLRSESRNDGHERASREEGISSSFYPIVKELCLNKCPAVSPIGVLDATTTETFADDRKPLVKTGWERIGLSKEQVDNNLKSLLAHPDFAERVREQFENRPEFPDAPDPESNLYGGFLSNQDANLCNAVRNADERHLADFHPEFSDERLPELLLHYKAKNFPKTLSEDEVSKWEEYRLERLNRQLPSFVKQMEEFQKLLAEGKETTPRGQKIDPFILEELSLWYQSLQPEDY